MPKKTHNFPREIQTNKKAKSGELRAQGKELKVKGFLLIQLNDNK